jgi:hypothetical protein
MNREQRRNAAKPEKYEPLGLMFRCPGVDGIGCPDGATLGFALGHKATDGLSGEALHRICEKANWTLAVCKLSQPDGTTVPALEPVCADCGRKIMLRVVEDVVGAVETVIATKQETLIDDRTKTYLKRLFGPGIPT